MSPFLKLYNEKTQISLCNSLYKKHLKEENVNLLKQLSFTDLIISFDSHLANVQIRMETVTLITLQLFSYWIMI